MTARHIYVDETKERGYMMALSSHSADDVATLRKQLREKLLPGQSRIHMVKERDSRRREICDFICKMDASGMVYDAARRYPDPLDAREACLQAIVEELVRGQKTLLILEQDDSILDWDKRFLFAAVRDAGLSETVRYVHHRASAEPLLSVPDAIAWCWARGGQWRQRIKPAVIATKEV